MLRMGSRFVMATTSTSTKLLEKRKLVRRGTKLAPSSNQPENGQRPHSTQVLPEAKSPGRRLTYSTSAGSVNPRRNLREAVTGGTSPSKTANLSNAFQRLAVRDQKKTVVRKHTTSVNGSCKSLEDVARWILKGRSKNIVIMAGAGISTPSGIPDFRTPGSGLYDNLQQYKIPTPEAIFDLMYFHNNPRPFFTLAKELYPGGYRPNYVHYFVRMLHKKGKLLRMYTQNIDGLERLAGIPPAKLVEAHGTFSTASCIRCQLSHDSQEIKDHIMAQRIPRCKRQGCTGVVKPDIVFFGEDLPKRFFYYLKDLPQCDMVIIMGTSLEVHPFAGIVNSARGYVPRVLINREAVGPFAGRKSARFNDLVVTGDLVENVQRFARVLGWKKAMEDLMAENETLLDEKFNSPQPSDRGENGTDPRTEHTAEKKKTDSPDRCSTDSPTKTLPNGTASTPVSRSLHTHTTGGTLLPKESKDSLPHIDRKRDGKTHTATGSWRCQNVSSDSESSTSSSSGDSDSSSDR